MKTENISALMLKDHEEIVKALQGADSNIEKFKKFKWKLENHFFTEEEAVFIYYNPKDEAGYAMIPKLMAEHKAMLMLLEEIEDKIEDGEKADLTSLKKILIAHRNYEDRNFYPILDRELDKDKKKLIIQHIRKL